MRTQRQADSSKTDTHSPFLLGKKVRSVIEPLLLRRNREQSHYFTTARHRADEPGSSWSVKEPRRQQKKSEKRRPKPTIMAANGWRPEVR